jgi:hypothetical protein
VRFGRANIDGQEAQATNTLFDWYASSSCPVTSGLLHRRYRRANEDAEQFPKRHCIGSCTFRDVPYYVIDFTSAGIELLQVLLKVPRVSISGRAYAVAGKFISRLHCANWHSKCSYALDFASWQKTGISAFSNDIRLAGY